MSHSVQKATLIFAVVTKVAMGYIYGCKFGQTFLETMIICARFCKSKRHLFNAVKQSSLSGLLHSLFLHFLLEQHPISLAALAFPPSLCPIPPHPVYPASLCYRVAPWLWAKEDKTVPESRTMRTSRKNHSPTRRVQQVYTAYNTCSSSMVV